MLVNKHFAKFSGYKYEIFRVLFLYKHEYIGRFLYKYKYIGRFSNLHYCTFNSSSSGVSFPKKTFPFMIGKFMATNNLHLTACFTRHVYIKTINLTICLLKHFFGYSNFFSTSLGKNCPF